MNVIFSVLFFGASVLFLARNADAYLPALLTGAQKAASLSLSLLASYCIWLGFFRVMEQSGLSEKLARTAEPLCRRLFRTDDREAVKLAAGNLSANLLGLPGAPTPLGIRATERFCAAGNGYGAAMLFVLNATSLQLLPSTVLALRTAAGSSSPADILPATLLSTLLSTLLGMIGVRLFCKRR